MLQNLLNPATHLVFPDRGLSWQTKNEMALGVVRIRVIVVLCSGVRKSRKARMTLTHQDIRLIGTQQQTDWPAGDLKGLTMFDWEG